MSEVKRFHIVCAAAPGNRCEFQVWGLGRFAEADCSHIVRFAAAERGHRGEMIKGRDSDDGGLGFGRNNLRAAGRQ
jgi:hypothetical protein